VTGNFGDASCQAQQIALALAAKLTTISQQKQWRRQLWGTGARAPSTSDNFILVHFGVNLTGNYPNIAGADANNSQLFRSVLH